jgi:DNA-binding NarL/FixJ family response regulator
MGLGCRRSGENPGVPVVILSGEIDPHTIRSALGAGAAGFLPKTMRGTAMLGALASDHEPESAMSRISPSRPIPARLKDSPLSAELWRRSPRASAMC